MGPSLVGLLNEQSQGSLDTMKGKFLRLGDFLLSGLTESRVIYACCVDVDAVRLHLVHNVEAKTRAA
jgi:hypothetical protein